ncbi:MAG: hypothetical protein K1X71_18340 [Pirellulales bacterium]|nr:hypothetical protein [Pirellulales bacterium]
MTWQESALDCLSTSAGHAYRPGTPNATEPTALAALALTAHGREGEVERALGWLRQQQNADGSLGVTETQDAPCWPTSLAVLAWHTARGTHPRSATHFGGALRRGTQWLVEQRGEALDRTPILGHDPTIVGWPWVAGTHSWLEPTAWAVLALRATGNEGHQRTQDGMRLLIDRLLPTGGANYGNTFVLGQKLRPQLEPTGLALLALAGQHDPAGRIEGSCGFLTRSMDTATPAISLSYALLGLAAQEVRPTNADELLAAAASRTRSDEPLKWALLLLAALGDDCPLLPNRTEAVRET